VKGASTRFDEQLGAICFWYKPRWNSASKLPLRPHSVFDFNGPSDDTTCQMYYVSGSDDPVAPDAVPLMGGFPRLVLLVWDSNNQQEIKVLLPLIDLKGNPLLAAGQWLHISFLWDASKVMLSVRLNTQDPGLRLPIMLADSSGKYHRYGGRRLQGDLNVSSWSPTLAKPTHIKLADLHLGGPLKTRAAGNTMGPAPPDYQGPSPAPSDATYANLHSFKRTATDSTDVSSSPSTALLSDPDYLEIQRLHQLGRYYNGDSFCSSPRYAYFDSRVFKQAEGHPLGTISWRGHLSIRTSLTMRILRRSGARWEEVPDPEAQGSLSFSTAGGCAIGRSVVDKGLAAESRLGPIRYRVYFIETVPVGTSLSESPYLESVQLTVLSPPTFLEWRWN